MSRIRYQKASYKTLLDGNEVIRYIYSRYDYDTDVMTIVNHKGSSLELFYNHSRGDIVDAINLLHKFCGEDIIREEFENLGSNE